MGTQEIDNNAALIELTSDIVAAHVSNNSVAVDDVPVLIKNVHAALAGLGAPGEQEETPPEPAVSIRASIQKNAITCLDCGKKMKMLKRHLSTEHGLTVDEYRQRWGLASNYPMVAPAYAETRRTLAKKIGLGRKPGQKVARKAAPKKAPAAKKAPAKAAPARKKAAPARKKPARK